MLWHEADSNRRSVSPHIKRHLGWGKGTGAAYCWKFYNNNTHPPESSLIVPDSKTDTDNDIIIDAGHNLPDKSCVADTAMQIELA